MKVVSAGKYKLGNKDVFRVSVNLSYLEKHQLISSVENGNINNIADDWFANLIDEDQKYHAKVEFLVNSSHVRNAGGFAVITLNPYYDDEEFS